MSTGSPVEFMLGPAPEDLARADIYAVLARFFYAPADPPLLDLMANSPPLEADESTGEFARAWAGLIAACAATNENAAQDEFDALFVGVGKAPISPYLGAWLPVAVSEYPLVDLRAFLLSQGLARQQAVSEPEDHIAAVYEGGCALGICVCRTRKRSIRDALAGHAPSQLSVTIRRASGPLNVALQEAPLVSPLRSIVLRVCRA